MRNALRTTPYGIDMRIGVDACCWSNRRGFGRFTRELLKSLIAMDQKNDYWFFVDRDTASMHEFPQGVSVVIAPTHVSPVEAASASGRRSVRDLWALSWQVMKHDLDIFFFPAVYSYFPVFSRAKILVTIHDMIPHRYPEAVFPNKKLMLYWKLKQYLAVRQSDFILTVSEYSKEEIVRYCTIAESRVRVVSEGPNAVFTVLPKDTQMVEVLRCYHLNFGERFLLYVGGISPHKNLGALLEAYQHLITDAMFSDVKLVLVGDYQSDSFYSDYPTLKHLVDEQHLERKVIFTGFIDDRELAYLYNAASLLVFPSLLEGFGLPAVEAMACGTPVAANRVGSLPEILGEAGRFFDPYHPAEMLDIIKYTLSNDAVREKMRRCGLMRAKQFTWDKAATQTLSIFEELGA